MVITTPVAADLALLSAALDGPAADLPPDVAGMVLMLAADARLAVASFVGLTVTVLSAGSGGGVADRVALRFTLLDVHVEPGDVRTSLRLPRPSDGAGTSSIAVILYAATAGAFVDMAADVSYMTGREFDASDLDQHRGVAAEADITGVLPAESTIGEAIGVLIGRGRTPEQAYAELDTLAASAHTDRGTEAAGILTALTRDGPDVFTLETPDADLT